MKHKTAGCHAPLAIRANTGRDKTGLTFRRSADAFARNFLTAKERGLERAGRDAKEGEHLALQLCELEVEDLDGVSVLKQMVALGEAEQP